MSLLRLPRLARVFTRLTGYFASVESAVEEYTHAVGSSFVRLTKLVIIVFVASHWFACMFFFIADYVADSDDYTWMNHQEDNNRCVRILNANELIVLHFEIEFRRAEMIRNAYLLNVCVVMYLIGERES